MLRVRRRRGFTLVELLIVIIIMGILAGSMMLTMSKARAKARATRIVNDMIAIKRAAQFYFADNSGWFDKWDEFVEDKDDWCVVSVEDFQDYLDQSYENDPVFSSGSQDYINALSNQYFVYINQETGSNDPNNPDSGTGGTHVFVGANVEDDHMDYATRKALEKMAPKVGLYIPEYTDVDFFASDFDPSSYYFVATEDPTDLLKDATLVMRVE